MTALAALGVLLGQVVASAQERVAPANDFPATDRDIMLAPYVWKRIDTGSTTRVEAAMPGAYIKAVVQGTRSIELVVDGAANSGAPASAMPIVDYSVDNDAFKSVQLSPRNEVYLHASGRWASTAVRPMTWPSTSGRARSLTVGRLPKPT